MRWPSAGVGRWSSPTASSRSPTGRSIVQLSADAGKAPLAYSLSLLAAVVYLVATTALLLGG